MIRFYLQQIKFLSSTAILLLSCQSLVLADSSIKSQKQKIDRNSHLIAQMFTGTEDVLVPNPTIKIDGKPVQPSSPTPPPFLPRAVAPPVGDLSVSNVNSSPPIIDLSTTTLVPRLVLRDAPVQEVLALLGRAAGLNVIFTDAGGAGEQAGGISLDLENEPVQEVFNSVLMISGLKANRQGNTLYIGSKLPPMIRNTITRSVRLNQYDVIGAALFLNSQGAKGNIVKLAIEREERDIIRSDARESGSDFGSATGDVAVEEVTQEYEVIPLESEAKEGEHLILEGLTVHADPVHDIITLVGEPHLVSTAMSFLTQLDARRRQVAVNVKVVDVQLDQRDSFGSSFSFGIDDAGIVQDGGVGVINFGTSNRNVDPLEWRQVFDDEGNSTLVPAFNEQITITEDFSRDLSDSLTDQITRSLENTLDSSTARTLTDSLNQEFSDTINRTLNRFGNQTSFSRDQVESLTRSLQEDLTDSLGETLSQSDISNLTQNMVEDITDNFSRQVIRTLQGLPLGAPNSGRISPFGVSGFETDSPGELATVRPGRNFNVPQAFLAQIRANVESGNAKILTDPTLVVQEGQVGTVELVENVVVSIETENITGTGGSIQQITTPVIAPAGLILTLDVQKIDDNGFISLVVNPTVSAPGTPQEFNSGVGANNIIRPLVERKVSSGLIRIRDGQTLILSGIIQDGESIRVSKVPILGDLPIIGSLFRSTFKDNARSEVIVMLTPQIINDSEAYSGFGYNYTPSRETGKYLRDRGLTVPTSPY